MRKLRNLLIPFAIAFLVIEIVGLLVYHLLNGQFSLSLSTASPTFLVIWFFVSILGASLVTRRLVRRKRDYGLK